MTLAQRMRIASAVKAEAICLTRSTSNLVDAVMVHYGISRSEAMALAAREGWINVAHFRKCVGIA